MANHIGKGKLGESAALALLRSKGMEILFTNYRWQHKEVDIIAVDNNELVFVEVKARTSLAFGYPEEAVDEKKQNHLKEAAAAFLLENPQFTLLRFDIVAVMLKGKNITDIVHWEGAFY